MERRTFFGALVASICGLFGYKQPVEAVQGPTAGPLTRMYFKGTFEQGIAMVGRLLDDEEKILCTGYEPADINGGGYHLVSYCDIGWNSAKIGSRVVRMNPPLYDRYRS